MATKEEISDKLNLLLQPETDINFAKMSKEDLEQLTKLLADSTRLIQLGLKQLRNKARKEVLDRPLKEFLDSPIFEELKEKGRGGIFGLGILPAIFREEEPKKKPSH